MDMSTSPNNGTMMTMSMMSMTFFSSTTTPVYSAGWAPTTVGAYAGTCLFLIVLGVVFRTLLAAKAWKEAAWRDAQLHRRYVTVAGKPTVAERVSSDADSKRMTLSENGVEEEVLVVKTKGSTAVQPWRLSVDPVRAAIDTVIAGVAYLLMLAVMTMNVGYFLSVLGGVFLGSLLVGRYATQFEH